MITEEAQEEEFNKIIKGLDLVYQRLIEFKKQKNSPLVMMQDGKIVHVNPHDIKITDTNLVDNKK